MEFFTSKNRNDSLIRIIDLEERDWAEDIENDETMAKMVLDVVDGDHVSGRIYLFDYIVSMSGNFVRIEYFERSAGKVTREIKIKLTSVKKCVARTKDSQAYIEFTGEVTKSMRSCPL